MIERIAIELVFMPELTLRIILLSIGTFRGLIAYITDSSKLELHRAPYFVYMSLIFLIVGAFQFIWLQSVPAILAGHLWIIASISLISVAAGGFFLCRIAMARSRDAFGHSRMAILAFVPLANLWLLAKAPMRPGSPNRAPTIRLATGGLGVAVGLGIVSITFLMSGILALRSIDWDEEAQTDPTSQAQSIELMVITRGLEETLSLMAAESRLPAMVDEFTSLTRIEALGTELHRTYVVDLEDLDLALSDEFHADSIRALCAHEPFAPLFRAGATIHEIYVQRDGRTIGTVAVTPRDCRLEGYSRASEPR